MKKSIIFLLFLFIFQTVSFAGKDVFKISKAEETLYEKNPWNYLEKVLDELDNCSSNTKKIVDYTTGLLIFTRMITTCSWIYKDSKQNIDLVLGLVLIEGVLGTITTGVTLLFNKLAKFVFRKRIEKERLVDLLEGILKKYDPDLSQEDEENVNYKKIIPTDLHNLFDGLHKKYLKKGKKYLKKHNLYFIDLIRQKIYNRYVHPTTVRVVNC
jgi:hypothetical protein